jgi:hypothetical protein
VFHYYWKHTGFVGRLLSPIVAAGLATRVCLRLLGQLFKSSSVESP